MGSDDNRVVVFSKYESTLNRAFASMFQDNELTDATLICDNKPIRVHKFVLSAHSSYFDTVFRQNAGDCSIPIKNVSYDDLMKVLEYIYEGYVVIEPCALFSFVRAIAKLSISLDAAQMETISVTDKSSSFVSSSSNGSDIDLFLTDVSSAVIESKLDDATSSAGSKLSERNEPEERSQEEAGKGRKKQQAEVVHVNYSEFFERMFKAKNMPWPMSSTQAKLILGQAANGSSQ